MTKKKQSLKHTIQLILDILSFESSDVDLKHHLSAVVVDWDSIVIIASKHLVLPAVYCRLQQKSLLSYVPEELKFYLEELTHLNRVRNQALLTEAQHISTLFQSNNINHVFIKGIALLAGNYFEDFGERMIGDIDVLVASDDLDTASQLLASEGYSKFLPFNYEVKNFRHLPRQISATHLGAVELHDQLLKHNYNQLIDKEAFLLQKDICNGVSIPKSEYLIWNTILAQQINDSAFYYNIIKLKGIYDVLALRLNQKKELIGALSSEKYSLAFLNLASIFCTEIAPSKETHGSWFKKNSFILHLNCPKVGKIFFQLKSMNIILKERIGLFFFNKSYRHHVIKNKMFKSV